MADTTSVPIGPTNVPDPHRYTIRDQADARRFIARRYPEYAHVASLCQWVLDTIEGGDRYKRANYRTDPATSGRGGVSGNLIRHRREWPIDWDDQGKEWWDLYSGDDPTKDPGRRMLEMYNRTADQNFEVRILRTPTPTKFRQIIDKHLSQIFKSTPHRDVAGTDPDDPDDAYDPGTPMAAIKEWWTDVDGRSTSIDEWMRETVGPLLIALGMLDVYCDHPSMESGENLQAPGGDEWIVGVVGDSQASGPNPELSAMNFGMTTPGILESEADVISAGIKACHAQYILPQNVLWYRLDYTGRYYEEVLIREYDIYVTNQGIEAYREVVRHWTKVGWTLYDTYGNVIKEGSHGFGRVPIVRIFDRHHFRIPHAGDPRFFGIVEKSREIYNEESELIYAMDLQCFAILQSPPIAADESGFAAAIGPGITAYMVEDSKGSLVGYSYVAPPLSPLEFIMQRLQYLEDQMDIEAGLNRPSSAVGKGGKTYPASGISKAFDQEEGNNILAGIAMSLQTAEYVIGELAATVLLDRAPSKDELAKIEIEYTTDFNLLRYDEVSVMAAAFVEFRDNCGYIPEAEKRILEWMSSYMIRGLDPKRREIIRQQIDDFVTAKADQVEAGRAAIDAMNAAATTPGPPTNGSMIGKVPATITPVAGYQPPAAPVVPRPVDPNA